MDMMKSYSCLSDTIGDVFGGHTQIEKRVPVSGGDINRAYLLSLMNGEKVFMKANSRKNIDFFTAEAEGLSAIRKTAAINVPLVLAIGTEPAEDMSFLLLEYIEPGRRGGRSSFEDLGEKLARMHLSAAGSFVQNGKFGFLHDNYIGTGVQINDPRDSWITFFTECRLLPQYERASSYFGHADKKRFESLFCSLNRYLVEPKKPALLHGDLWSGNYMIDADGRPWLIDPAVYVGHPEADLAMTELFGGFEHVFYDAYREAAGIDPGYRERRDLYNLYHLLNHLNMFGSGYLQSVISIVRRFV